MKLSKLLNLEYQINLCDGITPETVVDFFGHYKDILVLDPLPKRVPLLISSEGGCAQSAESVIAIIHQLEIKGVNLIAIASGEVGSAATDIFMECPIRVMMPQSHLLFHRDFYEQGDMNERVYPNELREKLRLLEVSHSLAHDRYKMGNWNWEQEEMYQMNSDVHFTNEEAWDYGLLTHKLCLK